MNKTKLTLYVGFSSVFVLLLVLVFLSIFLIQRAVERMEGVVLESNTKLHWITEMRTSARERTVSLEKMLIIEDPLDVSDEWERFYSLGSRFIHARTEFISMKLTKDEKHVLDKLRDLVRDNSRLQVDVTELILEGRSEEARDLLLNEVMPVQDQVYIFMTEMMDLQREAAEISLTQAHDEYEFTVMIMVILSLFAAIISVVIMRKIIHGISQSEQQLFIEKERAQTTLQSIGDAVISTDEFGRIVNMNKGAESLLHTASSRLIGRVFSKKITILSDNESKQKIFPVETVLEKNQVTHSYSDSILVFDDGSSCAIEYSAAPIHNKSGIIIGIVISMRDVSKIRALTNVLAYQASYDELTGLVNRREFGNILKDVQLSIKNDDSQQAWLCFIDLDKFKIINDSCGHQAGDEVLRRVSMLFKENTRETDYVARLGGDEFCLILRNIDLQQAEKFAERLRVNIEKTDFVWNDEKFKLGASIGIAQIMADDESIDTVLHRADSACYEAKHAGRNQVQFYEKKKVS